MISIKTDIIAQMFYYNNFFFVLVMGKFAARVEVAVQALGSGAPTDVDENDFIDASRLVYDAVREIRRAVLMNRVFFFLIMR